MPTYWLTETDLSAQTPEIPGGVAYGLVDESNPPPPGASLFEGDNALVQVTKAAEAAVVKQIDRAVAVDVDLPKSKKKMMAEKGQGHG